MMPRIALHALRPTSFLAFFLIVALGTTCPTIAVAQDSSRLTGLGACLDSEEARNAIQSAVTDCYRDELGRQDAVLKATCRAMRKRLSPARFVTLRASERQWIARTNKKCWGDPPRNDGTDGVQDSILCLMLETERRTDWLHTYRPR